MAKEVKWDAGQAMMVVVWIYVIYVVTVGAEIAGHIG